MTFDSRLMQMAVDYEKENGLPSLSVIDFLGALDADGWTWNAPRVASKVEVHFVGGPWAGQTYEVERVVGPVFGAGHEVGNHYWLDSKSDPPTYHWDGSTLRVPTQEGETT